jgi:Flp pilus assembly protein TadD
MPRPAFRPASLSSAEIRLLLEVGLMACGAGNTSGAESIFMGLRALRPNEAQCFIGLAMACIEAGAAQDAVSLLRGADHLPFSKNIEFRVFLAMSLIAAGRRNEAERELRQLLAESQLECPERQLAYALLARHGMDARVIEPPQISIRNQRTGPYRTA